MGNETGEQPGPTASGTMADVCCRKRKNKAQKEGREEEYTAELLFAASLMVAMISGNTTVGRKHIWNIEREREREREKRGEKSNSLPIVSLSLAPVARLALSSVN